MEASSTVAVPDPKAGEFAPGTLLNGCYRMIRCLSRGGMGEIHLASRESSTRRVVVKVLSSELVVTQGAMVEQATVRFRQEAMVMASIRHPNVVQLLDFNLTPSGRPYLVMEYLPGQNLSDVLATKTFSAAAVSSIVRQVASALDAADRLGVVHRDLKPENIMVMSRPGQSDLIKVIDFGICKARGLNHLTSNGMVMGTPDFMSPEQAEGRHEEVEASSDQFALAVITYLLLAGRMPWPPSTAAALIRGTVYKHPLPLAEDGSCRPVENVLFRAMAPSPKDRYPSILAFSNALDGALLDAGMLLPPGAHLSGTAPIVEAIPYKIIPLTKLRPPPIAPAPAAPAPAAIPKVAVPPAAIASPASLKVALPPRVVPKAIIPKAMIPKARPQTLDRQRKRGTRVGWAAMGLMILMFGAYLASVGGSSLRGRVGDGWNALRNFAAGHAARGAIKSHRLFSRASRVSKNAKVYLSLESSP